MSSRLCYENKPLCNLSAWLRCLCAGEGTGKSEKVASKLDAVELIGRVERARKCFALLDDIWPDPNQEPSSDRTANRSASSTFTEVSIKPHIAQGDFTTATSAKPRPCHRIGRFIVREKIGHGGHGIVYRAHDPILERDVALKLPRPESLGSHELRQRFVRESRSLAGLTHPNLVSVYEAGMIGPICYLATAYCSGPNLAEWIKQQGDSVDPHRVHTGGLAALHAQPA